MSQDDKNERKEAVKARLQLYSLIFFFPYSLPWIIKEVRDYINDDPNKERKKPMTMEKEQETVTDTYETNSIHSESIHTDSRKKNLVSTEKPKSGCSSVIIGMVIIVLVIVSFIIIATNQTGNGVNSRQESIEILACDGSEGTFHQSSNCLIDMNLYVKNEKIIEGMTETNHELSRTLSEKEMELKQKENLTESLKQQNRELRNRLLVAESVRPVKKPEILDAEERLAEFRKNYGYNATIYDNCSKNSINIFMQCVHRTDVQNIKSLGRIRDKVHNRCREASRWLSEYLECVVTSKR